ncbi:MAG: hypothetical protein ABIQ44_10125 [Chloroflexia bacterium]
MKLKAIAGSTLAATLMGVGVLAGSVIGNTTASAQTPSVTPSATVTAPTTKYPSTATDPATGAPAGRQDGFGGGRGHDGMDGGMFGGSAATADGATRSITNATSTIASVNTDLAYATSKMDTAQVQEWLNGAAALLKSAETANAASQFGQANSYATAAGELARAADSVMSKQLGAANLPSYADRPQHDNDAATTATVTQAQASRVLAEVYKNLAAKAADVKSASNASEATPYLTDAQAAYKTAYDAYGAGNYADAISAAHLASQLGHVASAIAGASTAPANADTPVTVPAPNF